MRFLREPSALGYMFILAVWIVVLTYGGYKVRTGKDGWRHDLFINTASVLTGGTAALMVNRINADARRRRRAARGVSR